MNPIEYASLDALAIADLVRRREVSRVKIIEAAAGIAARRNPDLNAICFDAFDDAREMARLRDVAPMDDLPLDGVPFVVKDLFGEIAGWPERRGSSFLKDNVSHETRAFLRRLAGGGMIAVGKATTPEFGLIGVTESDLYGATRNPWSLDHTPGGSSGGSAASVAAGIVPVAHANDGGGSIRIPASCTGLVGLKPSRNRTCGSPEGELALGFGSEHVLTRTVRDCAAVLDLTCGNEIAHEVSPHGGTSTYLTYSRMDPQILRVAFWEKYWTVDAKVHAECVAAVQKAAAVLSGNGHMVEEARPQIDFQALMTSFGAIWAGMAAASVAPVDKARRSEVFEAYTLELANIGSSLNAGTLLLAREHLLRVRQSAAEFHETYDVLLTPVLGTPPLKIGEWDRSTIGVTDRTSKSAAFMLATTVANASGQPSISIPIHWSADGLPVGVMMTAAYGREDVLLQLAGFFERELPWRDKTPPIWG